jgi:hypothetical protein
MTDLQPIALRGGAGFLHGGVYKGFIVPDTEGLMAIDERSPADPDDPECPEADWVVTHIPTMYAVRKSPFTDASTREKAIAIAQCFYRECKNRGWPIASEDPSELAMAHNALPVAARQLFWEQLYAAALAA